MLVSRRVIAQAVNLANAGGFLHRLRRGFSPSASVSSALRPSAVFCRCMCSSRNEDGKEDDANAENKDEDETKKTRTDATVSPHLRDKFLLFEDRDSEVILDVHEEFQRTEGGILYFPEKADTDKASLLEKQMAEHSLERGQTGVYDIEDLVSVLEAENVREICVIRMPPEMMYADYMVIANGRSHRHLAATMEFVRKLYKKKMNKKSDKMANVQGELCKTWMALDVGNIVLHLMMPEERKRFDIESLWAVGENFDDRCLKPQDTEANVLQNHLDYLDLWRPLQEETAVP